MNDKLEEALDTISKGGTIVLFGTFLAKGLAFLSKLLLAKYFGPSGLGLIALSLMLLGMSTKLSAGGFGAAIKKFVPKFSAESDDKRVSGTIITILTLSITISVAAGFFIYAFSSYISVYIFESPDLAPILRIMAFLIPFQSLVIVLSHVFLAFEESKIKVVLRDVGIHSLHFLFFLTIIILGGNILHVAYAYVLTGLILVSLSLYFLEKKVYPILKKTVFSTGSTSFMPRKMLRYSAPLVFSGIFVLAMGWTDTFMLGFFKTEDVVGIYNFALTVSLILLIFLNSMNQIFFPVIADFHAREEFKELASTFRTVLRWIFLLTFPFFAYLAIFSRSILSAFFPQYTAGWMALSILSLGMMFRAGLGPVGHTLKTYDETRFIFKLNAILLPLNIVLNFFLIQRIGLEGAAIATATVFIMNNTIEMWKVRKIVSFSVELKDYAKYIGAALIPLLFTYLFIELLFVNRWVLIISFALFLLIYLLILVVGGAIKEEDIVLFRVADVMLEKLGMGWINISQKIERFVK